MSNLITISGAQSVAIALTPDSIATKAALLAESALITEVSSIETQERAVATLRNLKANLKAVEDSRQSVKGPVLELGRKIDGLVASYVFELDVQSRRISKLIGTYQVEQIHIAREAERKRQEELARAEAERQRVIDEENRKAEEAERQHQAELDRASAQSRVKAAILAEAQKEQRATEARAAAERIAAQSAVVASITQPMEPPKAQGMHTRKVWKFEVLYALQVVKAHPEFCRIEVSASAVNRAIFEGMRECPGLRIWEETQAIVRS